MTPDDPLTHEIIEQFEALALRIETVLGPSDLKFTMELRFRLEQAAKTLSLQLRGGDDHEVAGAVTDLVNVFFPDETPIPDTWWGTELGRIAALSVGHPGADAVSHSVAAAMLGVSRPRVTTLVGEGKLAEHPGGGVAVDSIQQRLTQHPRA
ncbi:hypothetical protein [Kitasatospora sp. NPDC086791]|uniref:hypothetical protein n=1 Tax=Kitasatospora sp. NPDC086791 TaxID=3155178 RepID=UPI0034396C58